MFLTNLKECVTFELPLGLVGVEFWLPFSVEAHLSWGLSKNGRESLDVVSIFTSSFWPPDG